jgi:mannose-6-phosphate isomerase-like protein (cupin superfamily)
MFVTRKEMVSTPLINETGEKVYELIGPNLAHGNANNHSLAYVVIPPGGSSSHHFHNRSEETYFILKGQGRILISDQERIVTPGDTIFISPDEHHQIFAEGIADLEFVVVSAPPWSLEDNIPVNASPLE